MSACPKCEQRLATGAQFCDRCGTAVTTSTTATAVPFTNPTVPLQPALVPAAAAAAPLQAPAMTQPVSSMPIAPTPVVPQNININVTTNVAPAVTPVVVMAQQAAGPGCLVRGFYFLFIGSWLSQFWIVGAWLLNLSVLGLPLGLMMLNRVPQIATLKAVRTQTQVTMQGGAVVISQGQVAQQSFLIRALYFAVIGWWLSLLWAELAWLACVSVIGLPFAFWMFDRIPALTTLARR